MLLFSFPFFPNENIATCWEISKSPPAILETVLRQNLNPNPTPEVSCWQKEGTVDNRRSTDFKLLADLLESLIYDLFSGDQTSSKSSFVLQLLTSLHTVAQVLRHSLLLLLRFSPLFNAWCLTHHIKECRDHPGGPCWSSPTLGFPMELICHKTYNLTK